MKLAKYAIVCHLKNMPFTGLNVCLCSVAQYAPSVIIHLSLRPEISLAGGVTRPTNTNCIN